MLKQLFLKSLLQSIYLTQSITVGLIRAIFSRTADNICRLVGLTIAFGISGLALFGTVEAGKLSINPFSWDGASLAIWLAFGAVILTECWSRKPVEPSAADQRDEATREEARKALQDDGRKALEDATGALLEASLKNADANDRVGVVEDGRFVSWPSNMSRAEAITSDNLSWITVVSYPPEKPSAGLAPGSVLKFDDNGKAQPVTVAIDVASEDEVNIAIKETITRAKRTRKAVSK